MPLIESTLNRLRQAYDAGHREVIVAYSCGKDSVATLDLCRRVFDRVHCYFLYFHPNLNIEQQKIRQAEQRFEITITQLPHVPLAKMLRTGYFMHSPINQIYRDVQFTDIYAVMRDRTGCELIAQGHRMDESLHRRGMIKSTRGWDKKLGKLYPLWNWNAKGVYSYLRFRKLTPLVIKTFAQDTSGISLGTTSLQFLKEHHPGDYQKLVETFPLAATKLLREELHREAGRGPIDTFR